MIFPEILTYAPMTWQPQQTPNSCGQSCIGIIVGRPASDIVKIINKKGLTVGNDLRRGLEYFNFEGLVMKKWRINIELPLIAIVKLIYGASVGKLRRHWSVWDGDKKRFIDPSIGYLENYKFYSGMRLTSYMEIVYCP